MLILILLTTFSISLIAWIGLVTSIIKEAFLQRVLLLLIAFAAGALIAGAFLHLLMESLIIAGINIGIFLWTISGFSIFFLIEQLLHWHHHHLQNRLPQKKPVTYMILFADGLHNFIGGLAIGGSFLIDINAGFITALIEAAHEVPQELGDYGILIQGGWRRKSALIANFISALTIVPGALISFFFLTTFDSSFLLPFAAGNFLYIAASDLIPEIKNESSLKRSLSLFFAFIGGILFITILKIMTE